MCFTAKSWLVVATMLRITSGAPHQMSGRGCELHVRFPQVTASALPSTDTDDSRLLSVRLLRSDALVRSVSISLTGRDVLRTKSSCSFSYDPTHPDQALEVTLIEEQSDLARLTIPLDWLPRNAVVRESFHMKPIHRSIDAALIFLEAHRRERSAARPWAAPLANITPRASRTPAFTNDCETAEFAAPSRPAPALATFSAEVFSQRPSQPIAPVTGTAGEPEIEAVITALPDNVYPDLPEGVTVTAADDEAPPIQETPARNKVVPIQDVPEVRPSPKASAKRI